MVGIVEQSVKVSGDEPASRSIEVITSEILFLKQSAGTAILEIGRRLIEAKEQLPHGEWLPWLAEKVEFSEKSAQRFMKLAKEYENTPARTDLGLRKALALLAFEPFERDEFLSQKHEVNGVEKTVEEMTTRELDAAIKAQKKAEKENKYLQGKLDEKTAEYDSLLRRSQQEVNDLTDEIEALRKQKTEVVEVVDTSRADKLGEKLKKKESEIEKLEAKLKEKESSLQAAREAAENQKKALERAVEAENKERIRAAKLEKQLASGSAPALAEFKLHFEQAKASINKMLELCQKTAESGDAETAEKFKAAIKGVLGKTIEVADSIKAPESQIPGQLELAPEGGGVENGDSGSA